MPVLGVWFQCKFTTWSGTSLRSCPLLRTRIRLAVARVVATHLWDVSAYDPVTLSSVAALLLITGVVACWIPARRASRIDPLVALRYE
jgi:putative ABC transport system permease protein